MPKFNIIIIGPGRCGTTLLLDRLATHSHLTNITFEPLCWNPQTYLHYHDFITNTLSIDIAQYSRISKYVNFDILQRLACQEYLDYILQHENLIKFIYNQFTDSFINCLKSLSNTLIIHLSRKNILYTYASHQQLIHNNVVLDVEGCSYYINKVLKYEAIVDRVFAGKIIKIYYEDLVQNWNWYIKEIQRLALLPYEKIDFEYKEPSIQLNSVGGKEHIPALREKYSRFMVF